MRELPSRLSRGRACTDAAGTGGGGGVPPGKVIRGCREPRSGKCSESTDEIRCARCVEHDTRRWTPLTHGVDGVVGNGEPDDGGRRATPPPDARCTVCPLASSAPKRWSRVDPAPRWRRRGARWRGLRHWGSEGCAHCYRRLSPRPVHGEPRQQKAEIKRVLVADRRGAALRPASVGARRASRLLRSLGKAKGASLGGSL